MMLKVWISSSHSWYILYILLTSLVFDPSFTTNIWNGQLIFALILLAKIKYLHVCNKHFHSHHCLSYIGWHYISFILFTTIPPHFGKNLLFRLFPDLYINIHCRFLFRWVNPSWGEIFLTSPTWTGQLFGQSNVSLAISFSRCDDSFPKIWPLAIFYAFIPHINPFPTFQI